MNQIVSKTDVRYIDAERYRQRSKVNWNSIMKIFSAGLPPIEKYAEDTWEWTTSREFFDHFVSRATTLLDISVKQPNGSILNSLVDSCFYLELAIIHDSQTRDAPSTWKNLGISYMHLVRNKERGGKYYLQSILREFNDTFISMGEDDKNKIWWHGQIDWKTWASERWSYAWGKFLDMKGAESDASYEQVKSIYETIMKATSQI